MKTFKILFAAVIIAGFATTAMAQTSSSDDATATAEARVITDLSIEQQEDISWGDVEQDSQPDIDPTDGSATAAGLNDSGTSVGKFLIDGTDGASIIINWNHNDLTGPGGDEIVWGPELSYLASDGDNEADESGGDTIENGDDEILGTGGKGMVFVGGKLTIGDNQMPGTYDGDITVTVEYN